nr:LytTR family transcriptional regulator DNA-binding domain-containing protein [Paenibacillus xylanexedens]
MIIPVIDMSTKEVQAINVSEIFYVERVNAKGEWLNKIVTENSEYQMLTGKELINYLNDNQELVQSDNGTYINPTKVENLNIEAAVAEFGNGKQASVARSAMKKVQENLEKSK